MKDFEKALKNLSLPDIEVDRFRQDLRRDLLRAQSVPTRSSYGFAFAAMSGAAMMLALVVAVFILQPRYPARLHAMLGGTTPAQVTAPASGEQLVSANLDTPYLRELLSGGTASKEMDQALIESWYREQLPGEGIQVKALEEEKIYALRQFQLSSGKRIVVYTELGNQPQERRVSY